MEPTDEPLARRNNRGLWAAIASLTLLVASLAVVVVVKSGGSNKDTPEVACLNGGGSWDARHHDCSHEPSARTACLQGGGNWNAFFSECDHS